MSMVVAKFESVYAKHKGLLTEFQRGQHRVALAATFTLRTWDQHANQQSNHQATQWLQTRSNLADQQGHMNQQGHMEELSLTRDGFVDLMLQYWGYSDIDFTSVIEQLNEADTGADGNQLRRSSTSGLDNALKKMTLMIFSTMDVDRSMTVNFAEFESVVAVSRCIEIINDDELMAYKAMSSRIELLLEDDQEALALVPKYDWNERCKLIERITRHLEVFYRTSREMHNCIAKVHKQLDLCSWFSMAMLDASAMFVVIGHIFCLSLYNTSDSNSWIDSAGSCFAVV